MNNMLPCDLHRAPGEWTIALDCARCLCDRMRSSVTCVHRGCQVNFPRHNPGRNWQTLQKQKPSHRKVPWFIILYWITSSGVRGPPSALVAIWLMLIKQLCASYSSAISLVTASSCSLRGKCHRSGERWDVERRRCHMMPPWASTLRKKHKCGIGKQMKSIVVCSLNRNDLWGFKLGHGTKYRLPWPKQRCDPPVDKCCSASHNDKQPNRSWGRLNLSCCFWQTGEVYP